MSWDSQVGVLKFPKLRLPQHWRCITLCANLRFRWSLNQSYGPCQDLSNDMWHTIYIQGNQGDSWLLMVENQILILGPFLGHKLCFNYPNGLHKPILDIYVSRDFQWYKKLFNPMGFDPCNRVLKIQESIETPTPKVGAHLGVLRFIPWHSPTLPHSREHECVSQASLLALTFASPCLGRKPKVKVVTILHQVIVLWSFNIGMLTNKHLIIL